MMDRQWRRLEIEEEEGSKEGRKWARKGGRKKASRRTLYAHGGSHLPNPTAILLQRFVELTGLAPKPSLRGIVEMDMT